MLYWESDGSVMSHQMVVSCLWDVCFLKYLKNKFTFYTSFLMINLETVFIKKKIYKC